MIEFKGPCGHTIRTDEGHVAEVVRCSYCGQPAVVPDQDDPSLDYLFRDVQQPDEPDRKKRRRWKRNRPKPVRGATNRGVDVFGVILRMCYAALLIIIVVLVGHHFVLPQFRDTSRKTPTDTAETASEAQGSNTSTTTTAQPIKPRKTWLGVAGAQRSKGLFVLSVPSGAAIDCLPADDIVEGRRLRDIEGCIRAQANGVWLPLPDNTYVVEVSLPWSDPRLNDPALPHFRRYREFRHGIENASDEERHKAFDAYFVPDEASETFVHETEEQIYLVRRYRGVDVRGGRSKGIRALFLPRIAGNNGRFSIAPLVEQYLPARILFGFDEEYVRNELDYYRVPLSDRAAMIDMLTRVGVAPYVTPDGQTRVFKIDLYDGSLSARIVARSRG